jgi:putative copper export protein
MAEAVLEETDREEVERLAGAIAASQQSEIQLMQGLLNQRGITVESSSTPTESHSAHEEPHQNSHSEPDYESQPGSGDGSHPAREATDSSQETASGMARGVTQGAAAFLVGLVAFVALVWIPTSRAVGRDQHDTGFFVRWIWLLFGLLVVASVAEISLYAVRASGQSFSPGLLGQALLDTRVGNVWLVRLVSGLLTVVAVTLAVRLRQPIYWWWAAGMGGALLGTLTLTSHAAAEGLLPSLADWLHVVAASVWMGGLLGFALVLLGPPRAIPAKQRKKLRWWTVRRFSRVATLAVVTVIFTGVYAALLHVPDVDGLLGTPYGRVLVVKLGLAVLLLSVGGMNLALDGRGPFGRLVAVELVLAGGIFVVTGFLTSLPPAGVVSI